MTSKEHKQLIQNFLNMVCMETQGDGGSCSQLEELLHYYFEEDDIYDQR